MDRLRLVCGVRCVVPHPPHTTYFTETIPSTIYHDWPNRPIYGEAIVGYSCTMIEDCAAGTVEAKRCMCGSAGGFVTTRKLVSTSSSKKNKQQRQPRRPAPRPHSKHQQLQQQTRNNNTCQTRSLVLVGAVPTSFQTATLLYIWHSSTSH